MSKTLCIYHGNCADGYGAAWVVRKAFAEKPELKGETVDFFPGVYQKSPPSLEGYNKVLFVDFSYKSAVVQKMLDDYPSIHILVIDHHKTAIADLNEHFSEEPRFQGYFRLDRSGAMLAWIYFFADEEAAPRLLHYIQDRDLWTKELPGVDAVSFNIFSYPYDFDVWDMLMKQGAEYHQADGEAIMRKHYKDISELIGVGLRRADIGGYDVPVLNVPYLMSSEAGHILAAGEPFAACYMDTKAGRVFSLRSREDGVDVSEIAKLYGGGGHKPAAGFQIKHEDHPETAIVLYTPK